MENIDFNFLQLNRNRVLRRYSNAVQQLRQLAEDNYGVPGWVFDNYITVQYFHQERNRIRSAPIRVRDALDNNVGGATTYLKLALLQQILDRRRQIVGWLFYLTILSLCVSAYRYETGAGSAGSTGSNNRFVQSFVYPSMRIWRRMTMPLIQQFPRLTELYDESCLMGNPFFQLEVLNCAPCVQVDSIWLEREECYDDNAEYNETAEKEKHKAYGITHNCLRPAGQVPIAFKSNQGPIKLTDFYVIYTSNSKIFQRDAYRVHSTHHDVHNLEDLFGQFNGSIPATSDSDTDQQQLNEDSAEQQHSQAHNLWRCNRMLPARLLRPIFARPKRLPSMSVALERYIAIDTPQAPAYSLPETECPNVYVHQAVGSRFIILRPTSECRQRCRTLSMRLTQSFVLSYNWMHWKLVSAPDPISETLSISLIGSYC